jgi:cellulose biosynthesis protein BcsQ
LNVIAVYNIKGGVGKTATAVNLAWLSARDGARTLVWDLDPQGAASFYFRIKPRLAGGGKRLFKLLHAKQGADRYIKGTDFENLHLLPADFVYRNMDLVLDDWKKPTNRLRKVLRSVSSDYDTVFLDCPPSISLVSENIFRAADILLVPVIPTTLSLRTLEQVLDFVRKPELRGLRVYPFFSMVDRRKNLHCEITETLPRVVPQTLGTQIPYASDVERMGVRRAPLGSFSPPSNPAVRAYDALWQELKERLYGTARAAS